MGASISVVIPAYNAETTIEACLDSIATQTVLPDQIILVDDGSVDRTIFIAENHKISHLITTIKCTRNVGIVAALRKGVEASSGTYIARIDADDVWDSHHLQVGIEELQKKDSNVLFASMARFVGGRKNFDASRSLSRFRFPGILMVYNPLVHSSVIFRRHAYLVVGGYRQGVLWEDYDLWIRILTIGDFCMSTRLSVTYNVSSTSLSRVRVTKGLSAVMRCQLAALRSYWLRDPVFAALGLFFFMVRLTKFYLYRIIDYKT